MNFLEWSIDEIHALESDAQEIVVKSAYAALEAKTMQDLLERLPEVLRKKICEEHGAQMNAAGYGELVADAEKIIKTVTEVILEAKKAYLSSALSTVTAATAKFGIDDRLEKGGLLRVLAAHPTYLINRDEVAAVIKERDEAGTPEETKTAQKALEAAERRALQEQVMDYATAAHVWPKVRAFAVEHARREPTLSELREYLNIIDDASLREALQLTPASKVESLRIKPKAWRDDCTRLFTVALLCYLANHDDLRRPLHPPRPPCPPRPERPQRPRRHLPRDQARPGAGCAGARETAVASETAHRVI